MNGGRCFDLAYLPCGGYLKFLDEDRIAALYQMAIGRAKYDPRIDIDRYVVECPVKDLDLEICPAWNTTRQIVTDMLRNRGANSTGNIAAEDEKNFFDAEGEIAWIMDSDGTAGPVAATVYPRTDATEAVKYAAEKCSRRTERRDGGADNAKSFHAGIIAKILGWLNRKDK